MKELYLIRHAKSDWSQEKSDFERGLNKRGNNDAPLMGEVLNSLGVMPDLIISSPAKRAILTANIISQKVGYEKDKIQKEESLYLASEATFYKYTNNINDKQNKVFIFSHNPGITEFAESLTDTFIGNIPTTGICHILLDVDSWENIREGDGKLLSFDFPKNHK